MIAPSQWYKTLVTDTNIFIDLENANLIDEFLEINWETATTDFVLEELDSLILKKIKNYDVRVEELNKKEIKELVILRNQNKRISVVDISVMLLAEKLNGILLSGDRALIKLCSRRGKIKSHGILWVLEKMVEHKTVNCKQAYEGLLEIVSKGARLPKKNVYDYLRKWKQC